MCGYLCKSERGDVVIPSGADVQASIKVEIPKLPNVPGLLNPPSVPVLLPADDCATVPVDSVFVYYGMLCHTRLIYLTIPAVPPMFRKFGIEGSARLSNVGAVTIKTWDAVDQSSRLDWVGTRSKFGQERT